MRWLPGRRPALRLAGRTIETPSPVSDENTQKLHSAAGTQACPSM